MDMLVLWIFIIFQKIIPLFPLKFWYFIVRIKAFFFYYIFPIRRHAARRNLETVFPDKSSSEINKIIKGCYRNVLTVIIEFFYMRSLRLDELKKKFVITNEQVMKDSLKKGKGLIFVSAHFSNWELMAYGGALIFGNRLNIIVKEQTNIRLDKWINNIRETNGNITIEMKKAAREIFSSLARNELVCILGDQSAPAESVKVKFFGMEVTAFEGPAAFALRTGAPLFWGVPVRNTDTNYFMEAVEIDTKKLNGYNTENIQQLTQEMMSLLEANVRKFPEQWLWFHKRFKSVISYD
jgi:KDO2-lipid IV(A) lauroyltransferase